MRFLSRSLLGLFLGFMTLALLMLAAGAVWRAATASDDGGGPGRGAREQVYTARLIRVEAGPGVPVMQVYGQVASRRELQLRAGAAGRIVMLADALQEGGSVAAGQLLARIDPSSASAALESRQAERDDAQGVLADARRAVSIATEDLAAAIRQAELRETAVTRQTDLAARGLGTSADRETAQLAASTAEQAVITRRATLADAESAVTSAENALRRAEIALSEARNDLADTEIRAGFDGRVTDVTAVEGGLVSLNEQLATIIDPAALEVAIPLSLDQFARLLDGDGTLPPLDLRLVLDGSAGQIGAAARIDRAAASVAEGAAGRLVYARVTDGAKALRPGDFLSVMIEEPALQDVATVPAAAIGSDGTVLVAGQDGRLSALPVELLRRQGDDVIIAVPDALDGARIVAERSAQLGAGIRVEDSTAPADGPDRGGSAQRGPNAQGAGRG
ncbi:HlyD family efflux transporter periplasmic adaptor subunit [Paracoccus sp. PARArs4]|uniref:efflux RND transporter periplasmic adaptor subunit n=1 Tax=Paracoccus sp. PARArs4 TaxID=2853442 RepID=UPI0024A79AE7|nr:HlyD family efflux transporter periplasmic adaptor subunit [Paracoccus sp. PARArs4]